MRSVTRICAVTVLSGLSGCILSENPPYAAGDVVFEPALLGNWRQHKMHESPDILDLTAPEDMPLSRIERAPGSGYRVVRQEGGRATERQSLLLFKLGDHYFACEEQRVAERTTYVSIKVTVSGSSLILWQMDVAGILRSQPNARSDIDGVLTGSTAEVRHFLLSHANDPGIWDVIGLMEREGVLAVGPTGMTSQKQRTLDYWFALRTGLHAARVRIATDGWEASSNWKGKAIQIRRFTDPTGVDPDAVVCGGLAVEFCDAVANSTTNRPRPKDPLAAMVRGTFGDSIRDPVSITHGREEITKRYRDLAGRLEATRQKLSIRYGSTFPTVTDVQSIERGEDVSSRGFILWYVYAGVLLVLVVGGYYFYYQEFSPYARGRKAGVQQARNMSLSARLQGQDPAATLKAPGLIQADPKHTPVWNAGFLAGWEKELSRMHPDVKA